MKHALNILAIAALTVTPVLAQGIELPITHELKVALSSSASLGGNHVEVQRGSDIAMAIGNDLNVPSRILVIVSQATPQGDVNFDDFSILYGRSFSDHESLDLSFALSADLPEMYVALRVIALTEDGEVLSSAPLAVKIR